MKALLPGKELLSITIKKFPIHIEKTDNKIAANKFMKIRLSVFCYLTRTSRLF